VFLGVQVRTSRREKEQLQPRLSRQERLNRLARVPGRTIQEHQNRLSGVAGQDMPQEMNGIVTGQRRQGQRHLVPTA
jgi:hypothetical protein